MDPDRGINAFALAPRLLINLADLPATGLDPAGQPRQLAAASCRRNRGGRGFRRWVDSRLGRGERLESLDNARPEIRNMIERASRFLRLAALLTVVLAAVAVGLAADRYLRRHLDACAVMRCLGARANQILAIHGGEFIFFGLLATGVGCLLGFAVQWGLAVLLAGFLSQDLPMPSCATLGARPGGRPDPGRRLRRAAAAALAPRADDSGAAPGMGWRRARLPGGLRPRRRAARWILMIWVAGEVRLGLIVIGGFCAAIVLSVARRVCCSC